MAHYSYDDVKGMIWKNLHKVHIVTPQIITSEISILLAALKAANLTEDISPEVLFRDISSHINAWQDDPSVLRADDQHVNWIPEQKTNISWTFWKRYRQFLEDEKNWNQKLTGRLDTTTDSILGDIGNPADDKKWDRRGMVMGDVQSGKTANYTGLICKAVDAGYKLIIVLAGMTNDLRSQTQARLDLEFLGYDSEIGSDRGKYGPIGVGRVVDHGQVIAHSLTDKSVKGDFRTNKAANVQLGGDPIILVVKKNKTPLELICKWIEGQGITDPATGAKALKDIPVLVLDDEADNASINTKKPEEEPTSINRSIRKILKSFPRSSYVGYTATPFANIFILPDEEDTSIYGQDLFPRDFIYYITPPTHYIGAVETFGLSEDSEHANEADNAGLPLTREANDAEHVFPSPHPKDMIVDSLPESLFEAMKSFIISCAARRVRGQKNVHNSMLIHVTHYNNVQRQVMDLVNDELNFMRRMLETKTGDQYKDFINSLEHLWNDDYVPTHNEIIQKIDDQSLTSVSWESVKEEILEAISKIEVRGINGNAGGVLDYDSHPNGLNVIAVGGNKLSRGLTLEGLSVSYYTRPAKNYDTLLQMGRWFGYRVGYSDLCRLYTTDDLIGLYQHISVANEELKREFRLMELSKLTPKDYGLKVQTHPEGLISITASNKIRHGKRMMVTFSNHLSQTTVFAKNKDIQESNFNQAKNFISSLDAGDTAGSHKIWKIQSSEPVTKFLKGFQVHPLSKKADPDLLDKYISKLNRYNELIEWTVVLISNQNTKEQFSIAGNLFSPTQRTDTTPKGKRTYTIRNSNLISPPDQYLDLSETEYDQALALTIDAFEKGKLRNKTEPTSPTGPFIREARNPRKALLLIYPLSPRHKEDGQLIVPDYDKPILSFAISFPKGSRDETVEYQVNTKFWIDRYGEDDEDEESDDV